MMINELEQRSIMIKSYNCGETKKIYKRSFSRKFPPAIQARARQKLFMLNAAVNLEDLRIPPGNRLEALRGERETQHSVRINGQWRVCFEWRNGDAYNVEIVDYH